MGCWRAQAQEPPRTNRRVGGFLTPPVADLRYRLTMTEPTGAVPPRLAPFLAQWDYFAGVLFDRLAGLTDDEYLWEPAPTVLTVRMKEGVPTPDQLGMDPTGDVNPPRTLAWSVGHLASGTCERADYLVGDHRLQPGDLTWPMTAAEGVDFLRDGLSRWRSGVAQMSDADLDTVGRSAFPRGLDPDLPLIEVVWWVNKELIYHASEIWLVRDLYAAHRTSA
jgi:hypothetical protein